MNTDTNDYTKEISFWERLNIFVSNVQTNCWADEEEKEIILRICKLKIAELKLTTSMLTRIPEEFNDIVNENFWDLICPPPGIKN